MTAPRGADRRRERIIITAVADAAAQTTTIRLSHRTLAPFTVDQQLCASRHKPPECVLERVQSTLPGAPARLCDVAMLFPILRKSCPIRDDRRAALPRVRSPFSAPTPLVWADARDRPDAAEVRLRQFYAEWRGMIGGSHKSERRMLFRKIMDKVRVGARSQAA